MGTHVVSNQALSSLPTPVLSPNHAAFCFQAMVHELVGLSCNRVDLHHVPGIKPEFAEAVLSARQDPFFKANMYSNFGDLGMAVKGMVDAASRCVRAQHLAKHSSHDFPATCTGCRKALQSSGPACSKLLQALC